MTVEIDPGGAAAERAASDAGATAAAANRRRWLGLAVLSLGQLIVAIDLMVMLIALPTIGRHLRMSTDTSQWVLTSYALTYGALLLLGGRIADYGGRRRAFLIGIVGFAIASTLGGLAPDAAVLLTARALQGTFAALLMPAGLSLISVMFTAPKERARALAIFGAVAGSGLALGMVLGGAITEYLSWRWCLLINPPVCAITLVAGILVLPDSAIPGRPRYDLPGAVLGALGVGVLVYGFAHAGASEGGWGKPLTIGMLAAGVIITAAFLAVESRSPQPLLPLRLLRSRSRIGALMAMLLVFTGAVGLFLYLIYYLQAVKHDSAVQCGLALLPYAIGAVIAAGALEQPLGRISRRIPIVLGLSGATLVCIWFSFLGLHWSYAVRIAAPMAFLGVCVVCTFIAVSAAVLDDAPDQDSGVCGALFNVSQQLAFALGPALLTSIAVTATRNAAHGAVPTAGELIHGYHVGLVVASAIIGSGAVLSFLLIRPQSTG